MLSVLVATLQLYYQSDMRYPKKFTVKAWKKFDLTQQDILCTRYDIILTDHLTKDEKLRKVIKKIAKNLTIKNVNKGITKFNKGMSQFNTMIAPEKEQRVRKTKRRKEPREESDFDIKEIKVPDFWSKDQAKTIKDLLG